MKKLWPWASGLLVVVVTFAVWVPSLSSVRLNAYAFFPLFGLLAWSLMWTHYFNGALALRLGLQRSQTYTTVTEIIVFFCLWLHPGLLLYKLYLDNSNIVNYGGPSNMIFFVGAFAAWLAFISYDILVRYKTRPFWKRNWFWVSLIQAGAMSVIYIHAIKFGRHIQVEWFKIYWAVLGLILIPCMTYLLLTELGNNKKLREKGIRILKNTKLIVIVGGILAVIVAIGAYWAANNTSSEGSKTNSQVIDSSTSSNESSISLSQVQKNNGQNGAKCWVIVDTTVYQISGFAQWVDGVHTPSGGKARCGKDLTDVIGDSPHGRSVLKLLTVVGTYQQ